MKKILSMMLIVVLLLSTGVFAYADNTERTIKISVPEMITYNEKLIYSNFAVFDVVVYDWMQYSKISVIVNYNKELFIRISRHYPAIAGVVQVVHDSGDNGKRICRLNPPEVAEYYDVKDYSFDIPFDVVGAGQHSISFEVEAYDLDGKKVDVDLQIDNEIFPEIIAAETAGVHVINDLKFISGYIYEDYGTTVQDFHNKIKSDSFIIKNKYGTQLNADDIIPNGSVLEIMYNGYVAYTTKICVAYDVDCDGKVTAADARLALRYSAKLESYSGLIDYAADVNGKSDVTAADARLILRKAAHLD